VYQLEGGWKAWIFLPRFVIGLIPASGASREVLSTRLLSWLFVTENIVCFFGQKIVGLKAAPPESVTAFSLPPFMAFQNQRREGNNFFAISSVCLTSTLHKADLARKFHGCLQKEGMWNQIRRRCWKNSGLHRDVPPQQSDCRLDFFSHAYWGFPEICYRPYSSWFGAIL